MKSCKRAILKLIDAVAIIITIIGMAFIVWVGASVIDVNNHNLPTHESLEKASWNIFVMIDNIDDISELHIV